jgi:ribose transport system substrate-binding protein
MKRRDLIISAAMGLGMLAGCTGGSGSSTGGEAPAGDSGAPSGGTAEVKGTIGLSVLTLTNPFFKEIGDSMAEEGKRHGYAVNVVSGEFDAPRQANQVKDFIVQGVSAIVLTPCDSKSIGPAIQEANQAGIPVFTADIKCLAPNAEVVSHIATDNYQGGKLAGEAMVEALGEAGGKVAILDFKAVESCQLRVKGFKEVIAEHPKIRIVTELPGEGQKDRGYRAAEDALQRYPDLAGIFAINDPSALGARAALEKAGKADQVKIIGFDGQPEGKAAIRDGKIYADPVQFPDQIGKQTMEAIIKHLNGERVPEEILIPTALYRKSDGEKDPDLN